MFSTKDLDDLEARNPDRVRQVSALVRFLSPYFKPEIRGLNRIPKGAGLYVGNHSGGLLIPDSFLFGQAVHDTLGVDEVPYGLAHETALGAPILKQIIQPLGAVRASHDNAHRLFSTGRKVLVYPGGDLDAMRSFKDRHRVVFGSRRGYIRLALKEGVPIIPVVSCGSHTTFFVLTDGQALARLLRSDRWARLKVWPISLSLPWGLWFGPMPPHIPLPSKILMEVLPAVRFPRTGQQAAADDAYVEECHQQVLAAMQGALTALSHQRRKWGWRRMVAPLT